MSDTELNPNTEHFDVFLCHNSEDKAEIRHIADELLRRGIRPWLDEREIRPGQLWQATLEEQIHTIKATAVFVGKSGISPWQQMEIRTFIDQFVKRACPVIPVILSSATGTPELPIFLQNFHWVDFRKNHPDPYEQLISGVAGTKSGPEMEKASGNVLLDPGQDDAERRLYSPIANQPDEVDLRQLGILRDRVEEYWVNGVLKQSLYREVLLLLGKRTMDDVVERPPWKYDVVDLPERCRDVLLQDYTIYTIFDATGLLLILGEPGSGKTMSLLELAAVLINRAKDDPKERVPIVLNLSSWQKNQSLEEWIAAELSAKYRVPKSIAKAWLKQDYLVPLLDGLDEVQPANQPDCVTAINTFIETHNPSGIVVCSRLMEYQWLTKKLKLNGAICIEPLSPRDVSNFLVAGGPQLVRLRQAMNCDPVLQDLAQTPLMLSIMSLVCEGADGKALSLDEADSPTTRREQILRLYVERMFERKGSNKSLFAKDQTMGWISWLARKMKEQSQSVFMVEELQYLWLSSSGQQRAYEALTAVGIGLVSGMVIGFIGGLAIWLFSGLVNEFIGGLVNGLFFGLLIGLVIVPLRWLGIMSENEIHPVEAIRWERELLWEALLMGSKMGSKVAQFAVGGGVVAGGLLLLFDVVQKGLLDYSIVRATSFLLDVFGVLVGILLVGLVLLILGCLSSGFVNLGKVDKAIPNQGINLSMRNGLSGLSVGGVVGGMIGALIALPGHTDEGVMLWLVFYVLVFGLPIGFDRGGSAVVKHYALRLVLWLTGSTPFRFIPFLDHCAKLILLKKVGGGYMFIHRTLLEYFAALPPPDATVKKVLPDSVP
ncbi:MAG: TIR domain-containing protein [Nitrospira sp.]|nr:TIR domain-containing protein [Nitrospira sp.]